MRKPTLIIPVSCYLVVTLVLPLLNGAGAGFLEHAVVVLAACAVLLLARAVASRPADHESSTARSAPDPY